MVDVDKCVSSTSSFIEKLWLFILIDFTSITLCNSFINESSALLIIVTSVLIVCLKMFGEKIRIESIIVCFLSLIIDIVCNVVSLIIGRIANYFIGTQFIQMPAMTVLSKILYLIAVLAFLKKKASYKSQLNSKRWLTLIIVISILFIVAYILVTSYVFDNVDTLVNLFCTALIFIAIILILNIYGKILEENEESTRIRLKNEEIRYKKENEKVLSKMSEDIYQLKYRAFLKITFNITDDFKIMLSDTFTYDPVYKNNCQYYELEDRRQVGVISYNDKGGKHYTVDNDFYLGMSFKFGGVWGK